MTIVKFVQSEYTDFVKKETGVSNLTPLTQWDWYELHLLQISSPQIEGRFETKKEFFEYELNQGDKVALAGNVKVYGSAEWLTLDKVGTCSGVGPKLLKNIEAILGDTFTAKQLQDSAGDIKGLGPTTLEGIVR